jgi:hypothetical protein
LRVRVGWGRVWAGRVLRLGRGGRGGRGAMVVVCGGGGGALGEGMRWVRCDPIFEGASSPSRV